MKKSDLEKNDCVKGDCNDNIFINNYKNIFFDVGILLY